MTRPLNWSLCLLLVSFAAAYAVFTGGADDTSTFAATIFSLGLAGIAGSLLLFRAGPASRPERLINTAALLFIAYVAFQLVPLPLAVLHVISPMRAEIAEALSGLTGGARYSPLTVAPPTTWLHLARITAYAVAFFVVRQLVRRSPFGPWTAALPLVAIGAGQAAYGLLVSEGAMALISGSYPNRNHFAGLIEMTLPFAFMYALSVLNRSGRRGVLALSHVAKAALPLGAACLMLVAILFSSSKGGVVACSLSLFFMTALSFGRGLPRGQRWAFLGLLTLLLVAAFIYLTPSDLVERFGGAAAAGDSEGRVPVWRDTLHLIAAFPLFGCGLGAFFPAFLRYQVNGIGWAWTNAHNDYLQLFSELGVVGFLAPAVLMVAVFSRAVAAASDPVVREARFIGVACAGSLLAILIHSLTDFNTYVTANGLVLAWVAGVAATLGPPAAALDAPTDRRRGRLGPGVGPVVLLLALLATLYGGAWMVYLGQPRVDIDAERRYCRFGVCDTDGALAALRNQARATQPDSVPQLSPEMLLAYLDRDRAAPYRWDELGDALNRAGRHDEARAAFARAVALGPTSAATLLMAAEFQFDDGQKAEGFGLTSRALQVEDAQMYDAAFTMLAAKQATPAQVIDAVALARPAALAFLRRQLQTDTLNLPAAHDIWRWAIGRGYIDDGIAREYTSALLSHKLEEAAWNDWVSYVWAARLEAGYPAENRIFNGGFEREPSAVPFDWQIQKVPGVLVTFDKGVHAEGTRSLRLAFDGTENVSDVGVVQSIYLAPGRYTFRAQIRSDGLTTDQGVSFNIRYDAAPSELYVTTEAMLAPTDWTRVTAEFDAPSNGGMVSIRVVRKPSLKFDKLAKGNLRIDQIVITPANPLRQP